MTNKLAYLHCLVLCIQAASLLYYMLYYAEDNATQHIEALLGGLYKGCRDEESGVIKEVIYVLLFCGLYYFFAVKFCELQPPY